MKRWLVLIVVVVVLSAAGTVVLQAMPGQSAPVELLPVTGRPASRTSGTPKAVLFEPTSFSFGTMPQRATGKHTWKIKNDGDADLDIWMMSSTCSCTLAKFKNGEKAVVKPGETSEIDLEYETRENNGEYAKGATIGTSDPKLPSFALQVKGNVFPAVMTFPPDPVVNFLGISTDEDDHYAQIAVYSKDRPETKVVKVATSKPEFVTATVEPMSADDLRPLKVEKGEKVRINVKSGLPLGVFREEVVLTTDHPKQPEVRLTVTGRMNGPIALLPDRLSVHNANTRDGGKGELTLSVRGHRQTKFEVVKAPKGLQAEVVPVIEQGKAGRYRLVLTVPPGQKPVRVDDEIVLKTDHPKAAELVVPVSVWVLNAD